MIKRLLPALALVLVAFGGKTTQIDAPTAPADEIAFVDGHQFIGSVRCKTCHRKEEDGAQYPKWEASAHAGAFATLGTDEAKAIAAEKGIEDPQAADECLQCHVSGHGEPAEMLGPKYSVEEGVGCESCHGAGGDYYKKATMTKITAGELDGAELGLVTPNEETCLGCHNENSPTFTEFNYEERLAEIAHPYPDEN